MLARQRWVGVHRPPSDPDRLLAHGRMFTRARDLQRMDNEYAAEYGACRSCKPTGYDCGTLMALVRKRKETFEAEQDVSGLIACNRRLVPASSCCAGDAFWKAPLGPVVTVVRPRHVLTLQAICFDGIGSGRRALVCRGSPSGSRARGATPSRPGSRLQDCA